MLKADGINPVVDVNHVVVDVVVVVVIDPVVVYVDVVDPVTVDVVLFFLQM